MKVRRALVSVHDKTGVVELATALVGFGVEILSTGGTAKLLRESGVAVRDVAEVTGFPEMMDGRVKTLHPKIHGGILARRDVPEHVAALDIHGIPAIDLVVVALYPFERTVAKSGVTLAEAIEQIDVGGPTMIRAAAKNHASVAVITDPSQYAGVLDELKATGGSLGDATRTRLAQEAFRRTAQYDAAIAAWLSSEGASHGRASGATAPPMPPHRRRRRRRRSKRQFPHARTPRRRARRVVEVRRESAPVGGVLPARERARDRPRGHEAAARPELGYNNLLDFSAALGLLLEFDEPAAVVIKHTNPAAPRWAPVSARPWRRPRPRIRSRSTAASSASTVRSTWRWCGRWPGSSSRSSSRRPTSRRARGARADQEEVPRLRGPVRPARAARATGGIPQRARRPARAGRRPDGPRSRRPEGRHEAPADTG